MSFDYHEVKALSQRLDKAINDDEFMMKAMNKVTLSYVKQVKAATPVGQYGNSVSFTTRDGKHVSFSVHSNRVGGKLRRSWRKKGIVRSGNQITSTVINSVKYASWVNNGHRLVNRAGKTVGWVEGQKFVEKTEKAFEPHMESILEKEFENFLKELGFDG